MDDTPRMHALLASARDAGGERFDAAGWHYLDTLARRAAAHDGKVRRMLEAKLERAVTTFAERFAQARAAAAELLDSACKAHPQAAPELQRLFADADFQDLRRQCATLEGRGQCAMLGELVAQLESGLVRAPGDRPVLREQSPVTGSGSPNLELKTVRESRATWARMSVEKQLALAMKQAPENAGPINSHMLVLRSLAMMQAISPYYLNRVVSYVDTLLALDPREMEAPAKRKRAPAAKTAKPARTMKKS